MLKSLLFSAALALQPSPGQTEFVPASSLPPSEQLPSAPLLVAAYAFVWLAAMFYIWTIWKRLGKVDADIRTLQQRRGR